MILVAKLAPRSSVELAAVVVTVLALPFTEIV